MSDLADVSTLEEAAEYLRLTPTVLRKLANTRAIGAIRQGNKWLFPRAAVEAWVEGHTVPAATPNLHGLTSGAQRNLDNRGRK